MADSAPITLTDLLAVQGALEARMERDIVGLKGDQRDYHEDTTKRLDSIDRLITIANGRTGKLEAEIERLKGMADSGDQARTGAALALGGDSVRATYTGPKTPLDKILALPGLSWIIGTAIVAALLSGQLGFAIHAATQHYWGIP